MKKKAKSYSPVAEYTVNGILFQVYRAKQLHTPKWSSTILKSLVMRARKSYMRYGPVAEEDAYDVKSAIYLTRAVYTQMYFSDLYPVEEWLSMRFVPADGLPQYTEDLIFCLCDNAVLVDWLLTSNLNVTKDITNHILTMSRICSIPPYIIEGAQDNSMVLPEKLKYPGISFALMNKQFLDDCRSESKEYTYITGLFHDKLINNILTIVMNGGRKIPFFRPAYDLLGFEDQSRIKLNRSLFFIYEFSGYFLKTKQLYNLLVNLMRKGSLTANTFTHYIQNIKHIEQYMNDIDSFKQIMPKIGALLTTQGPLYGAKLTGEQLRRIIDEKVDDGPTLRMMKIDEWQKDIRTYLRNISKPRS